MASLEVGSLQATLTANTAQFVTGMTRSQKAFQGVVSTVQTGSNTIQQNARQATVSLQSMATGIMGLQRTVQRSMAAIGAYTILPSIFSKAKSAIIDFNQQLDQSRIAMTHFAGSAEDAEKLLATLQEFAARTPFNFQDLLGTTQQMMAMGVAADELLPRLTAIGDAAAALGGSPEVLYRIQRALGQIQAKGRVQAEELMQLAEVGVPAYQYMADVIGGTIPQALDKMKRGEIDAATAVQGLLDGLTRDFNGMMESQSKTMMGALSTVQDYVQMTVASLGRPLFEALRETMLKVANFLSSKEMQEGAKRMAQNFANALRQVGDVVGQALKVIGPVLVDLISAVYDFGRALASGLDQAKPLILGMAGGVFVAIKAFQGLLSLLAPVVKLFAENKTLASTLAVALGVLALRSKFVGTNVDGQAKAFTRLATSFRTNIAGFREYITTMKRFEAANGRSITTFGALRTATVAGFKAMGMAVKSFMASLGPMIAMIVAIEVAVKIFDAISNKNRDLKERMNELSTAIRDNTTALLENAEALKAGANGADILSDAILKTGDNAAKLTNAFGQMGRSANLMDFAKASDNFVDFANNQLKAAGASQEMASQMADLIDEIDKGDTTFEIVTAAAELGFTPAMVQAALALEEIQDQAENIDFTKLIDGQVSAMIGSGQVTASMVAEARALADAEATANGYGEAAKAVAFNNHLMQIATDYARESIVTAEQHAEYYQSRLAGLQEESLSTAKATKNMATIFLEMQKAAKDGKVEFDDFKASVLGGSGAIMQFDRMMRNAKKGASTLFDSIVDGKKTMEDLKFAGYDLTDILVDMKYQALELGMDTADVANAQRQLMAEFIASAKQAGFLDSEITKLIQDIGILDALNPEVAIALKLNVEEMRAQVKTLIEQISKATNMGKVFKLSEELSALQAMLAAIEKAGGARRGGGGGGGSKEKPFEWVKDWLSDLSDYVKGLFSEDFREQLMRSTPKEIGKIIADVVEEGMQLGLNLLPGWDKVVGQIMDLNQQMQLQAVEVAKAQEAYDRAAEKVAEYESALASLKDELSEFLRIESGATTALERLAAGKDKLEELRTTLQSLRSEYEKFRSGASDPLQEQIGVLNNLQASFDRLVDSYNDFEKNINNVQSPLEREIQLLNDLRSEYENLTKARDDYQKSVTESLGTMKFEARGGVLGQARRYLAKVEAYKNIISGLKDRNFPPALIQEVLNSGLDAGTALGRKLLALSDADLASLLEVQKQINQMAADVGGLAADVLFTADVSEADRAFKRQIGIVRQVYQQAMAEANQQFQSQYTIVDALYQQQIATAQQAFDQQKMIVEGLYRAAIAEAERILNESKSVAGGLQGALIGVQTGMNNLITALGNAVKAIVDALKNQQQPPQQSSSGGPSYVSGGLPGQVGSVPSGLIGGSPASSATGGWEGLGFDASGGGYLRSPGGQDFYLPPGIDFGALAGIAGRANGGPVSSNRMYMVGEVGPELFVPRASGTIVPNSALGGSSNYNITINARGGNGDEIGRQVVKAIQEYERRNGKGWRN